MFRDPAESTTAASYSLNFPAESENETSRGHLQDETSTTLNDTFLDFDAVFDPNDLSWLMTIPLDS